jgi:hypothetical protein
VVVSTTYTVVEDTSFKEFTELMAILFLIRSITFIVSTIGVEVLYTIHCELTSKEVFYERSIPECSIGGDGHYRRMICDILII